MPETYYYATGTEVTFIADAIRTKGGTSQSLTFPDDFVQAIEDLVPQPDLGSLSVTPTSSVQHFFIGNVLAGKFHYRDDYFDLSSSDISGMSNLQAGDTCYVRGSLRCVKSGATISDSIRDVSGTFVWQEGTNTYVKNGYTLTFTTSSLSVTSGWDGYIYAYDNNPDGQYIIGLYKVGETQYDGWDDVTVNAIPSGYYNTSAATVTSGDVIQNKIAFGSSGQLTGSLVIQHYYTGSTEPSSSLGSNGDIYLKT